MAYRTYYETTQKDKHVWRDSFDDVACGKCIVNNGKRKTVSDKLRDPINMHNSQRRDQ